MTTFSPFDSGPAATKVMRDVITASGPDAEVYLQGQLSQDIAALESAESAWSLLLQPQGKVDAWLRVTRLGADSFLLDVDEGAGEDTLARLDRFKLRTDCMLELARWSVISIRGPRSSELELPSGLGEEVVVPARWPGIDGVDLLGTDVTLPAGVPTATVEQLEALRIAAGVPAMGTELTEDTIPAEAGIVDLSVSFTKGCYTGQELVARIDSRGGNVPKRLRGITADEPLARGDIVQVDGDDVGQVTSVSGSTGLAYVRRAVDAFPASARVGSSAATIHELPMI